MAAIGEIGPWMTETPGERLFLIAYNLVKDIGQSIPLSNSWIVSTDGFSEFIRLVAAMELTHRCLNVAVETISENQFSSVERITQELRRIDVGQGISNGALRTLAEATRLAAIAYVNQKLTDGQKNRTHKNEKPRCCWCGTHTTRAKNNSNDDTATVEHLWPEYLGGTSVEENLTIACKACNTARQHAFTWAWFALQSCNEELDRHNRLPRHIYLALALYRLMRVAAGKTRISRNLISLKEASTMLKGAVPEVVLQPNRRYTFFEILSLSTE